jgi:hypothetical protein
MLPLPELYNHHLKKHLERRQYLILSILVNLLQGLHQIRLEELANRFPHPIQLRKSLSLAMSAYSQRMGIEEMFRDFKKGGYQLEGTQVTGQRLISLVVLISLAYCWSTFSGESLQQKGVAKYVSRPTSPHRSHRQHSSFYIGLHGQNWLDSLTFFQDEMEQLMSFSPHKHSYYRKGLRAASLIQSAL